MSNTNRRNGAGLRPSPAALALQNWKNQVALLDQWEQDEIEAVYQKISALLHTYQSSAALAATRAALEIALVHGE